jgi:hypothetical protein
MVFAGITTTFAGDGNWVSQIGLNSGSIESHMHVPAVKCLSPLRLTRRRPSYVPAERRKTPPQLSCFVHRMCTGMWPSKVGGRAGTALGQHCD